MTGELTVLQAGSVFHDRYEVSRCIRRGGMGAVYEVRDAHTTRRRALKVMLPKSVTDPDLRARFKQETTITAEVRSDHTVEIFDAGIDDATGSPFLVMELLEGEDLSTLLERGPLDAPVVSRILSQLARVLDKTHAAGIVHRDLKPENLFLSHTDDAEPRLKVLDFGVAKLVAPEGAARTTRVLGTPLYMSKEQILGDGAVGPPADLYAMAHIAYAMLTGRPYWLDEASSSPAPFIFMSKVLAGAPEPASERARRHGIELPSEIDAWFARATDLDPMQRFQRASELVGELDPILGIAPRRPDQRSRSSLAEVSARSSTTDLSSLAPRRAMERRGPALAVGALVAAGVAIAAFAFRWSEGAGATVRASERAPAEVEASDSVIVPVPSPARSETGSAQATESVLGVTVTASASATPSSAAIAFVSAKAPGAKLQAVGSGRAAGPPAAVASSPRAPHVTEPPDPTKVR